MSTSIPVLWADDIKVDIVPPIAILRAQVEPLRRMSGGLLGAEVTNTVSGEFVKHFLDVIAPALHGYRQRILSVAHHSEMVYPVRVESHFHSTKWEVPPTPGMSVLRRPLMPPEMANLFAKFASGDPGVPWMPNAETQEELIQAIQLILRSGDVRGLTQSLIARSNSIADSESDRGDAEPSEA